MDYMLEKSYRERHYKTKKCINEWEYKNLVAMVSGYKVIENRILKDNEILYSSVYSTYFVGNIYRFYFIGVGKIQTLENALDEAFKHATNYLHSKIDQ